MGDLSMNESLKSEMEQIIRCVALRTVSNARSETVDLMDALIRRFELDSIEKVAVCAARQTKKLLEEESAYAGWIDSVLLGGRSPLPDAGVSVRAGGGSFLNAVHSLARSRDPSSPNLRRERLLDSMMWCINAEKIAAFAAANPEKWKRHSLLADAEYEKARNPKNADCKDDFDPSILLEPIRGWNATPVARDAGLVAWTRIMELLRAHGQEV